MRGAGAFVEGITRGYMLGRKIKGDREEDALKDDLKRSRAEVEADRQKIIDNSITPNLGEHTPEGQQAQQNIESLAAENGTDAIGVMTGGVPNLSPEEAAKMPVDRPIANYAVKGIQGRTFATPEEAKTAATERAPDFGTLYANKVRDRLVSYYTEQGDMAKAKAAADWADDAKGKFYLRQSADVFTALNSGNAALLNDAYQKINSVYGNGRQDVSAEFDPADPNKVILTYTDEATKQQQRVSMTKDDVARQFIHQYNPEKGLEYHMAELRAKEAARAKAAQDAIDHKQRIEVEDFKAKKARELEEYKVLLNGGGKGVKKDAADLDKRVEDGSTQAQTYIASEFDNSVKAREKEIESLRLTDPEAAKAMEVQVAKLKEAKGKVISVAGEVVSYTLRSGNPALKDYTPADHKIIAEEIILARDGKGSKVKLGYDQSSGKLVELYADERKGVIPVTAPVSINPNLAQHHPAIIGLNNVDPKTGKEIVSAAKFEKMKGDFVARGGTLPATAEKKPEPTPAKPAENGVSTAKAAPESKPAPERTSKQSGTATVVSKPEPGKLPAEMQARYTQEQSEIDAGKRADFSPEVKAAIKKASDERAQDRQAKSDEWKKKELAKELARSRNL